MKAKNIVQDWFSKWEAGQFMDLPLAPDFKHTSPFGTIVGKDQYLAIVETNRDKFLGYSFLIHDAMYAEDKACIRYTAQQGDFELEVSEWHYLQDGLIREIIAYYHIGEIREDRQLEETNGAT